MHWIWHFSPINLSWPYSQPVLQINILKCKTRNFLDHSNWYIAVLEIIICHSELCIAFFNSLEICKWLLPMTEKSQRIILLQNPWNIWPHAHIAPFPRGVPAYSAPEQASYCWVFGCSCVVFLSDGPSMSARETVFDRTTPGDHGVTWSSWSKLDSWWESVTCERYCSLQVWWSLGTRTSKYHCGKIRCPHGPNLL